MNTRESLLFVAGLSLLCIISAIVFVLWLAASLVVDVIKTLKRRDRFIKQSELRRDSITPDIRDFKGRRR